MAHYPEYPQELKADIRNRHDIEQPGFAAGGFTPMDPGQATLPRVAHMLDNLRSEVFKLRETLGMYYDRTEPVKTPLLVDCDGTPVDPSQEEASASELSRSLADITEVVEMMRNRAVAELNRLEI